MALILLKLKKMNNKKIVAERLNLTGMVDWINSVYSKQTGNRFTVGDVQQYISRGHLPFYLGNLEVVKEEGYSNVKLYKVITNEVSD